MKTTLVSVVCWVFLICSAYASKWKPDNRLLTAIRVVESSGGLYLRGDAGMSLGEFQLQRAAWSDVSKWRKARGLRVYNYEKNVFDPKINRIYASDYMVIIRNEMKKDLKREPSVAEIYAAYNLGLAGFAEKCGYDLRRLNKVTASRCALITEMVRAK